MTLARKSKRLAQFMLIAFMAGEVSYAAAQVLVLRSVGPSARHYPAGQRLPDNARFNLRPGDSVVILTDGTTRTFRGPGTFSANGPARTNIASASRRINTGAVRGDEASEIQRPSDVWQIDVTQSGRTCIVAGARPTLWRPSADRAVQLTITPQAGAPQTVAWPQGQQTLAWPASVPIANDGSYQLSWTGGAGPTRVTARTVAALPESDVEGLATALLANQCRGQLDVLIAQSESTEESAGAPTGGGGLQ